jgi:ABC-type branched-subunit amino acid transport system permease subunit
MSSMRPKNVASGFASAILIAVCTAVVFAFAGFTLAQFFGQDSGITPLAALIGGMSAIFGAVIGFVGTLGFQMNKEELGITETEAESEADIG